MCKLFTIIPGPIVSTAAVTRLQEMPSRTCSSLKPLWVILSVHPLGMTYSWPISLPSTWHMSSADGSQCVWEIWPPPSWQITSPPPALSILTHYIILKIKVWEMGPLSCLIRVGIMDPICGESSVLHPQWVCESEVSSVCQTRSSLPL